MRQVHFFEIINIILQNKTLNMSKLCHGIIFYVIIMWILPAAYSNGWTQGHHERERERERERVVCAQKNEHETH